MCGLTFLARLPRGTLLSLKSFSKQTFEFDTDSLPIGQAGTKGLPIKKVVDKNLRPHIMVSKFCKSLYERPPEK